MPKGLEGEEEEAEGKALFEKRRERLRSREKGGKRKGLKDKDWILKKKEVRLSSCVFCHVPITHWAAALSPTGEGGRSPRLKIHWTQAEAYLLDMSICHLRIVSIHTSSVL